MLDETKPDFALVLPPELFQSVDALAAMRAATQLAGIGKSLALRIGLFAVTVMVTTNPEMRDRAYAALRTVGEQLQRFAAFLKRPEQEGAVHPLVQSILRTAASQRGEGEAALTTMARLAIRAAEDGADGVALTEARLNQMMQVAHVQFPAWSQAFARTVEEGVDRARAELDRNVEQSRRSAEQSRDRIAQIARAIRLIALNARVEASRAGEAGRAFGVLADEIKSLSEQTSAASQEVQKDIARITAILGSGV